ncbi:MAG: hypothetical protein [Caudoviricetes sp.]|nr:MAG: hypothetical protein [Caudoviricetes sp.]
MKALLNIIAGLLLLIQSYQAKKEQADAQEQANKINADPTDWFNTHFDGGVSDNSASTSSGKATHIRNSAE